MDIFSVSLSVVNLDSKPLTLMESPVHYFPRGDPKGEWKKAEVFYPSGIELPLKVDAGGVLKLEMRINVVDELREAVGWSQGTASFVGRDYPVILDIGFEDAAGQVSSINVEYVNRFNPFELKPDSEDEFVTTFCDDAPKFERSIARMKKSTDYEGKMQFELRVWLILNPSWEKNK